MQMFAVSGTMLSVRAARYCLLTLLGANGVELFLAHSRDIRRGAYCAGGHGGTVLMPPLWIFALRFSPSQES